MMLYNGNVSFKSVLRLIILILLLQDHVKVVNGGYNRTKQDPPSEVTRGISEIEDPDLRVLSGLDASASSTEALIEIDNLTLAGGSKIRRFVHKISNYTVWNSVATSVEKLANHRSLGPRITFVRKPNREIYERYSQSSARGRAGFARRIYISTCKQSLGDLIKSARNLTLSSKRFIYDNAESNETTYADLVKVKGYLPIQKAVELSAKHSRRQRSWDNEAFLYFCLVDTNSNKVIKQWSGIYSAVVGGNQRMGRYTYGVNGRPSLPVKRLPLSKCRLSNADETIQAFHMKNRSNEVTDSLLPFEYTCSNGPGDSNNRSYGALADTFYNAVKAVRMYLDQDWGGIDDMVQLTPSGKLKLAVHYRKNYDNAYWDGEALYFGDGSNEKYYALGSCLDIVAHEIGHSVTDMTSGLIYVGETGCLNEGFSDAMGEMAEFYATKKNDFLIAPDCLVRAPFLRNMSAYSPYSGYFPQPRRSICSGTSSYCHDPHICSAIPNFMFYKLATAQGWTTKDAGRAWMLANRLFWSQEADLKEAGCGVVSAVQVGNIANGDTDAVVAAWRAAGIDISPCAPEVVNNYLGNSDPATPKRIENCAAIGGIFAKTGQSLYYVVHAPAGSKFENIQLSGDHGDADLYVDIGQVPTEDSYKWAPFWNSSNEWVAGKITVSNVDYFIMIKAAQTFQNLELYACFYH